MKRCFLTITLSALYIAVLFTECRKDVYLSRLQAINDTIEHNPRTALSMLDSLQASIDDASDLERHYFMLLRVKAKDKAYIKHTSADTINRVVEFYRQAADQHLLPYAYYYQGNVLYDMHDSPRALDSYQKAYSLIKGNNDYISLKSHLCSMMGTLYESHLLYIKALEMHKQAYNTAKATADTIGMIYCLRDIAQMQERLGEAGKAESKYYEAFKLAEMLQNDEMKGIMATQLANILSKKGNHKLAYKYLKISEQQNNKNEKMALLAISADIYKGLKIWDKAFVSLNNLLKFNNLSAKQYAHKGLADYYRHIGNNKLLHNHLIQYEHYTDSLYKNDATNEVAKMNALFDYQLRERDIAQLTKEVEIQHYINILALLVIVCLIAISIIGYTVIQNKRKKLKMLADKRNDILRKQFEQSEIYRHELEEKIANIQKDITSGHNIAFATSLKSEEKELQTALSMSNIKNDYIRKVESAIKNEDLIVSIKRMLNASDTTSKCLSDKQWETLNRIVNLYYPKFSDNIHELCKISELDYHICLLIKINIIPSDISKIVLRSKEAISSSRRKLYFRAFNKKGAPEDWDNFIRSL